MIVNEDNINEIFDKEYEDKIEDSLMKIWDAAEKKTQEELDKIEEQMIKFLDDISNEKFTKTLEINNKYDAELKDLEADGLDLSIYIHITYQLMKAISIQ